jgi:cytochrome c oxidase cbb3-type subunit III
MNRRQNQSHRRPKRTCLVKCVIALEVILVWGFATRSQTPLRTSNAPPQQERSSGEGRKLFETVCAACHGLDGRGGERGPDIATRQEVLELSDKKTLAILQNGISSAGMPSFTKLGVVKLNAVLTYLRSLQGRSGGVLPGNPESGRIIFFGEARCSECHAVDGVGGFLGSDLTAYGLNQSTAEIRGAIVTPRDPFDPRRKGVVISTRSGETYKGIVRNEDNFSIQMQTLEGVFHFFLKSEVARIDFLPEPIMPADYGSTLSSSELDDLASYLVSVARKEKKTGGTGRNWDDEE